MRFGPAVSDMPLRYSVADTTFGHTKTMPRMRDYLFYKSYTFAVKSRMRGAVTIHGRAGGKASGLLKSCAIKEAATSDSLSKSFLNLRLYV